MFVFIFNFVVLILRFLRIFHCVTCWYFHSKMLCVPCVMSSTNLDLCTTLRAIAFGVLHCTDRDRRPPLLRVCPKDL